MKNLILKISICFCFAFISQLSKVKAQDSVYIMLQGDTHWFYIQTDVFAFVLDSNTEFMGALPTGIVDTFIYTNDDGVNYIFFNPTANIIDIEALIQSIQSLPEYETNYDVINQFAESYIDGNYIRTNNIVQVLFKDSNLTDTEIEDFAADYNLEWYWKPPEGLPPGNYTHLFSI
jgi:hypothetical protein